MIVDYSMPGLSGEELCIKLKNNPIKKVMLTAKVDYPEAIKLFNSGLIDRFIIKDDHGMLPTVYSNSKMSLKGRHVMPFSYSPHGYG